MTDNVELDEIIFDMLVPNATRDVAGIASRLSYHDWAYILERGNEHRFLPMLLYTLTENNALDLLPEKVLAELSQVLRRQSYRVLAAQREMLTVHGILDAEKIRHVFLKGAYLAQFTYPRPTLRPVRDLDVLVAPSDAKRALDALLRCGYSFRKPSAKNFDGALELNKHMPPLLGPSSSIPLELHYNLVEANKPLSDLNVFDNSVTCEIAGRRIEFMSVTDLLIHLSVHAVESHGFSNGPLVISDVGFLIRSGGIDWTRLWERASALKATRAVSVTLRLTESCWGNLGICYPAGSAPVPQHILQLARQLCLRSFSNRMNANLLADLQRRPGKIGVFVALLERAFPTRVKLRKEFGNSSSPEKLALHYLLYWRRLLTRRLPAFFRSLENRATAHEADALARVNEWLDARPEP